MLLLKLFQKKQNKKRPLNNTFSNTSSKKPKIISKSKDNDEESFASTEKMSSSDYDDNNINDTYHGCKNEDDTAKKLLKSMIMLFKTPVLTPRMIKDTLKTYYEVDISTKAVENVIEKNKNIFSESKHGSYSWIAMK